MTKYGVNLMKCRVILPSKEQLIKAFKDLYYREPTDFELSQIKVDMLGENAIIIMDELKFS